MQRVLAVVGPFLEDSARRHLELQRSHAALQALVENYPSGIVSVMDTDMRHLYVGGETVERLGFDGPNMIGKTPTEYRAGEKADALEANIRRALQGEVVRILENDGEMSTLVFTTPIFTEDGSVVGVIVVGQDVTDIVSLQEEIIREERTRSKLEREFATTRARAEIIERVLHELGNPLASLSSSVEILQTYDSRMDEQKRALHLARIYEQARVLAESLTQVALIDP